jgi:hypothetical protein
VHGGGDGDGFIYNSFSIFLILGRAQLDISINVYTATGSTAIVVRFS